MRTQVLASALFRGTSNSGGNAEMKGDEGRGLRKSPRDSELSHPSIGVSFLLKSVCARVNSKRFPTLSPRLGWTQC